MLKRLAIVLVVGSAGWLAIYPYAAGQSRDEEAARKREADAAAIEKLGGKVERDASAAGHPVVKVSLPTCTCLPDDSHLVRLESLTDLRRLELRNDCKSSRLTDEGLVHLRTLTKLEYLHLGDSGGGRGITDAGLVHLKKLTNLKELVVGDNRDVTEAGLLDLQRALPQTTIKRSADLSPPPLAEKFLHEGKFADGENASVLALDANPKDDEARFGLGAVQFVRAVENLGKALYEYGAVSERANQPFLRLPVPKNDKPSAISYRALGRVLDAFAADLGRAEATLAGIKDDNVKLRLRLARITFDFAGTGRDRTTLIDMLNRLNGGRFDFQKANPDFRVHFDRGDVAWLRAYCHLLCAMVEGYRAVDEEAGFEERVKDVFPRVEAPLKKADPTWIRGLTVVDAPRLRRMRLHLVAVCELNRETWEHIRKETDDDFEWLPNPKQHDQLGLPLTNDRIDRWLAMMEQWEGLLKGERLLPSALLRFGLGNHAKGQGLNLKKLLDDPPADLFNWDRIQKNGIDAKYLEAERGRQVFDVQAIFMVIQAFDGPFGFAYAARLN